MGFNGIDIHRVRGKAFDHDAEVDLTRVDLDTFYEIAKQRPLDGSLVSSLVTRTVFVDGDQDGEVVGSFLFHPTLRLPVGKRNEEDQEDYTD